MLLPISVNLCWIDFVHQVFQNCSAVLYFSRQNVLLPISENLCCLDHNHEVFIWICCPIQVLKELLNEPHVSALFAVFLMEKWIGFPKRYFSSKRLYQIFFFIHTTPLFLSCKYQLLCSLKTYQFLVIHEWPSVFSKQFDSLLLGSVFLTGC